MSNIYPKWWDTAVTVYNKYTDPQTRVVSWFRFVIEGTFWKYIGDKVTINEVTLQSNSIICRVRKDSRFLEKYQWVTLPNDQMKEHFTFGVGDIIVKGAVEDEIDEYTDKKRSSDLIGKYKELQGCMVIQQVANNTGAGRGQEHYHILGE